MPHHTASRGLSSPSAMTEAVIKVITVVRTPTVKQLLLNLHLFIASRDQGRKKERERERAHALYMAGS